jgi:hypothetical protein
MLPNVIAAIALGLALSGAPSPIIVVQEDAGYIPSDDPNIPARILGSEATGVRATVGTFLVAEIYPSPTNDYSDYSGSGGVTIAEDGFHITAEESTYGIPCSSPSLPLKLFRLEPISNRFHGQGAKVRFWLPGTGTNELDETRCENLAISVFGLFRYHRGAGHGRGAWNLRESQDDVVRFYAIGEKFPQEYLLAPAVGGLVSDALDGFGRTANGLYYNVPGRYYKTLNDCFANPAECPRRTGTQFNYVVFFTAGMDDVTSANFNTFWTFAVADASQPPPFTYYQLTNTYSGSQGYSYSQHNFLLNDNVQPLVLYRNGWFPQQALSVGGFPATHRMPTGLWNVGADN